MCGAGAARLRRGCGAGLRGTVGLAFLRNFCVRSYIGGSKAQRNAGADVVQAHIWCIVTLKEARQDCSPQCNAGADVVQGHMWVEVPIGKKETVEVSKEK